MAGYTMGGSFDEEETGASLDLGESPSFAVALGTEWEKGTELEIYYSRQATELKSDDAVFSGHDTLFDLDIHYLHIGGLALLTQVKDVFGETLFQPNDLCDPYIVGGLGVTQFRPKESGYDPATRFSLNLGFGAKFHVTRQFGFRLEGRGIATLFGGSGTVFSNSQGVKVYVNSEAIGQAVINAGVFYTF